MTKLKMDLTVGVITVQEGQDEVKYSVPLKGSNGTVEMVLKVNCRNRDILTEHGIDAFGRKVTVSLEQTNTTLTDERWSEEE